MQRAASGIASLALRRLAARPPALLAVGPAPLLAAEAPSAAVARFLLRPATPAAAAAPAAAALYARRGFAAGRKAKAKAVSESEDEEDEFEAMGSDGEFEGDFDDDEEDLEDFDDDEVSGSEDDDDCKPAKKRGRR